MFGDSRDAFGIAQYRLGYDVNSINKAELDECAKLLKQQQPLVQQYVMDEIFTTM